MSRHHLHPDEIVRLAKAANPALAHIWRQALEDEGIPSKVVGDYLDASLGDLPGTSPEVWVHKDDLARAQKVLERGAKASEEEQEDDV